MKIIAITGTRTMERFGEAVKKMTAQVLQGECFFVLGDAKGVDEEAKLFCQQTSTDHAIFYAHWDALGRGAGPERNKRMLLCGKPDVVWAFPGKNSKGTWNMVRQAKKLGIEVVVYED